MHLTGGTGEAWPADVCASPGKEYFSLDSSQFPVATLMKLPLSVA